MSSVSLNYLSVFQSVQAGPEYTRVSWFLIVCMSGPINFLWINDAFATERRIKLRATVNGLREPEHQKSFLSI